MAAGGEKIGAEKRAAASSAGKKGGKKGAAAKAASEDAWSDPPDASVCSVAEFAAYKVLYHAVYAQHGEAKGITGAVRAAVECWTSGGGGGGGPSAASSSPLASLLGHPVAVALVRQAAAERESSTITTIPQASGAPDALLPAAVANALRARAALAQGDPLAFVAAYRSAPALGRALLDVALPRLRFSALQALVRAFRPGLLPIEALARWLGFWDPAVVVRRKKRERQRPTPPPLPGCRAAFFEGDGEGAASLEEACAACLEWARAHGAVVVPLEEAGVAAAAPPPPPPPGASKKARAAAAAAAAAAEAARAAAIAAVSAELMAVDTRASSAPGVLSVPEDTTKVAHGDANLNIEDFLAKALAAD
jgi:hypothetical protein